MYPFGCGYRQRKKGRDRYMTESVKTYDNILYLVVAVDSRFVIACCNTYKFAKMVVDKIENMEHRRLDGTLLSPPNLEIQRHALVGE